MRLTTKSTFNNQKYNPIKVTTLTRRYRIQVLVTWVHPLMNTSSRYGQLFASANRLLSVKLFIPDRMMDFSEQHLAISITPWSVTYNSKGLVTVSVCFSVCDVADKWVPLTSMVLFTVNDVKHQRKNRKRKCDSALRMGPKTSTIQYDYLEDRIIQWWEFAYCWEEISGNVS